MLSGRWHGFRFEIAMSSKLDDLLMLATSMCRDSAQRSDQ
jgi:hypothetical protein